MVQPPVTTAAVIYEDHEREREAPEGVKGI
jgi:hypothetical protein